MKTYKRTQRRVIPERLFSYEYQNFILGLQPANLVACWPIWERVGATAVEDVSPDGFDGTPANVTFNTTTFNSQPAPSFNGTNSVIALPVAALDTPFNGAQMTISIWCLISAAVWADASGDYMFSFGADVDNRVFATKMNVPGDLQFSYRTGGVIKNEGVTFGTRTEWFQVGIVIDKANDLARWFVNGEPIGSDQNALGIWAGPLANGYTAIGDAVGAGAILPFNGNLAYCALWNAALTPEKVSQIYTSAVI